MPRGPLPLYRQRKEPILDHYVKASIDGVNGVCDSKTGHYATLVYTGCPSRDRANEIKNALYRSGKYAGVGIRHKIVSQPDGTYNVEFTAVNKDHARAYIIAKYGEDRSKWPYDPRKRNPKKNES